jgi:hypothetical protein
MCNVMAINASMQAAVNLFPELTAVRDFGILENSDDDVSNVTFSMKM